MDSPFKWAHRETSLVAQWLRFCALKMEGPRFDPWLQKKLPHATTESSHATTKERSQPNKIK